MTRPGNGVTYSMQAPGPHEPGYRLAGSPVSCLQLEADGGTVLCDLWTDARVTNRNIQWHEAWCGLSVLAEFLVWTITIWCNAALAIIATVSFCRFSVNFSTVMTTFCPVYHISFLYTVLHSAYWPYSNERNGVPSSQMRCLKGLNKSTDFKWCQPHQTLPHGLLQRAATWRTQWHDSEVISCLTEGYTTTAKPT